MSKLVLVTGGAGFVGSHLCGRLAAAGHRVISLDNYFAGSKENHVPGVDYREGHTKDIATLVPETPDLIYHLGEYARVHKSLEEPHMVWSSNIAGTLAVLEYWRAKRRKFVYAASSTKSDATITRDGIPGRDLTPYTWSKAANVSLINNYARWYGLPYAIAYFYNVYGPGERGREEFGTVVETFRQNAVHGRPHEVNAPGTQTRSFTHVDDTVDALMLIGEHGSGDGYNISANDVHSIRDVAELFGGDIIMRPQTRVSRSSGADDVSAITALGWQPRHTLKEYVAEVKRRI